MTEKELYNEYQKSDCKSLTDFLINKIAELEKKNKVLAQNLEDTEIINNALEKENAELKDKVENQKSFLERIRAKFELSEIDRKEIEGYLESENLTKAREIILRLYNAGRDVLMCRTEEKAYDNLSNAINDKSIEQFLNSEVEK